MAEILNRNNIEWSRPKGLKYLDDNGVVRHYFPDFWLPNQAVYLDPKNPYRLRLDQAKLAAIRRDYCVHAGAVQDIVDALERTIKRELI